MTSNMNSVVTSAETVVGDLANAIDRDTSAAFLAGHFLPSVRVAHQDVGLDRFDALEAREIQIPQGRQAFLEFIADWQKKYNANLKIGIISTLILPLAACGGGGGGGLGGAFGGGSGGKVIDGYISGATVSRVDGSGNTVTTDANGNFTGLTGSGAIKITGGTDISTGLAFEGTLTAPDGSSVVTPLTTLVQKLIEDGESEADALSAVKAAFNLTEDLKTVDPVATSNQALFKAGVQVANIMTMGAKALTGSGAATDSESAIDMVVKSIAAQVKDANTQVTFNDTTLDTVLKNAGVDPTLSADAASIISASNTNVGKATSINDVVKSQYIAQGEAANALSDGAASGDLSQAASEFDAAAQSAKAENVSLSNGGVGSFTASVSEAGELSLSNLPTSGNITLILDEDGGGSVVYTGGTLTIPDANVVTSLNLSGVGRPVIINDFGAVTTLTAATNARTTIVGSYDVLRAFIPTDDSGNTITGMFTFRVTGISDIDSVEALIADVEPLNGNNHIAIVGAADADFTITANELGSIYSLTTTGSGDITLTGVSTSNLAALVGKLSTAADGEISAVVDSGSTLALSKTLLSRLSSLDFNVDGTINFTSATSGALQNDLGKIDTTGHTVAINVTGVINGNFLITDDQLENLASLTTTGTGTITLTSLDGADDISAILEKLTVGSGEIAIQAASGENIVITQSDIANVDQLTTTGGGNLTINDATGGALDANLAKTTVDGDLTINGAADEDFTLTQSDLDAITALNIAGTGGITLTGVTAAKLASDLAVITVENGSFAITGAAGETFNITETDLAEVTTLQATGGGNIVLNGATAGGFAGDLAKISAIDNGTITITGAEGENLSITKTQLDDLAALSVADGSTITVSGLTAQDFASDLGKLTATGGLVLIAANDESFSITETDLAGINSFAVSGSGDVTLTDVTAASLVADSDKITVDGGVINIVAADGENLSLTQAQAGSYGSIEVTGAGNITITEVSGDVSSVLDNLTVASGVISVSAVADQDLSITEEALGDLGGLAATGTGNIALTEASSASVGSDLAKLTTDTGTISITVKSVDTSAVALTYADIAGKTVDISATGNVDVTITADGAYDFSKLSGGTVRLVIDTTNGDVSLSDLDLGSIDEVIVTGPNNALIQAEDVDGLTVTFSATGEGNVVVAVPEGTTIDDTGLSGDVEYQSSITYNESGTALDGYLVGATVMLVDGDGNQVGTQTWTTDANGHYSIEGYQFTGILPENVSVRVTGGTDMTTGQAFNGALSVSVGENASVVTSLTAVMHQLVAGNISTDAADAQSDLIAGLGLNASSLSSANVLTIDPVAVVASGSSSAVDAANAATLQIAAAEMLTISAQLAEALQPVLSSGENEYSLAEISDAVLAQIAVAIGNADGASVDWTNSTVLGNLVQSVGNALVGAENFDETQEVATGVTLQDVFGEVAELLANTVGALAELMPSELQMQDASSIDAMNLMISAIKIQAASNATLGDLLDGLFDSNGAFQEAGYQALQTYNDNFSASFPTDVAGVSIGELVDGTIYGSAGADILTNGDEGGRFYGNGGADTMTGGTGDDRFHLEADHLVSGLSITGTDGDEGSRDRVVLHGEANDSFDFTASGMSFNGVDRIDMNNDVAGQTVIIGDQLASTSDANNDETTGDIRIVSRIYDSNDLDVGMQNDITVDASGLTENNHLYFDGERAVDGEETYGGFMGNDTVTGGAGNDTLIGGAGDDTLSGNAGNDTLMGGDGNDVLSVTEGKNSLLGGDGVDTLMGGTGNDTLIGGTGADTVMGGEGDDRIFIEGDGDYLVGGDGKDRFFLNSTADLAGSLTIHGDGTEVGSTGEDRLVLQLEESQNPVSVDLTADNLTLTGIDRIDVGMDIAGVTLTIDHAMAASADNNQDDNLGDIRVNSRVYVENESEIGLTASPIQNGIVVDASGLEAGDSLLFDGEVHVGLNDPQTGDETYGGFSGDDTVYGGAGADTINGGAGNDRLYGNDGNDYLDGGDGKDRLYGGAGVNTLIGGAGEDRIYLTDVSGLAGSVIDGNGGSSSEASTVAEDRLIIDLETGADVDLTTAQITNIDRIDVAMDVADLKIILGHDLAIASDSNNDGTGGDIRINSRVYVDNESEIGLTASPITNGIFVDATAFENTDSLQFDGEVHVGLNDPQTGDETYGGFSGDDIILGGAGGDFIMAGEGDDRLNGNGGDDVLNGGAGSDRLHGGTGIDTLIGGLGTDRIYIDSPSELEDGTFIFGGAYDLDTEQASAAEANTNDRLILAAHGEYDFTDNNLETHNITIGQIDRIEMRENASGYTLALGDGMVSTADANGDGTLGDIQIVSRAFVEDGDTEIDVPITAGVVVDASSLSADHSIHFQGEILIDDETGLEYGGFSGNDRIRGGLGNDTINGGAGDDRIYYSGGADTLIGGTGRDRFYLTTAVLAAGLMIDGTLEAATNDRLLLTTAGNFDLTDQSLASGNVTITNIDRIELRADEAGNNLKIGSQLASTADENGDGTLGDISVVSRVIDDNDNDVAMTNGVVIDGSELTSTQSLIVEGEIQNDPVDGDYGGFTGNDTMIGGEGNDTLQGGDGNDTLIGNGGDDYLMGGSGADVMTGGAGNDIFAMRLGGEAVTVEYPDYTPTQGDYFEVVIDGYAYGARADESETSIESVLSDLASVINNDSGHDYHARVHDGILQIAGVGESVAVDANTYSQGTAYGTQPESEGLFAFSFTDTTTPQPGDFLRLTVGDDVFQVQMSDGDTPGGLIFQLAAQIAAKAQVAYDEDENADVVDAVALDTDGDSNHEADRLFIHVPDGKSIDFDNSGTIHADSGSVFVETDAGDSFSVDVDADTNVAQTGTLTLSTNDADYVAGSFLSVTLVITTATGDVETNYLSTPVVANSAAESIQALADEIKAQDAAFAKSDGDPDATFFDTITVDGGTITFAGKENDSDFTMDATFLGDLGPNAGYIDPAQGENDTFDAVLFDFYDFAQENQSLQDHGTFVLSIDDFTLTQPVHGSDSLADIVSRFADTLKSFGYTVGLEDEHTLFVASDEEITGHSINAYQAGSALDNGVDDTASALSDSTASMLDVITDFVIGEDKFDLSALGGDHNVPSSISVDSSITNSADQGFDLSTAFEGLTLQGDGAAMFVEVSGGGEAAGTYLIVDNGDGAVNSSEDLFINVTGISGDIDTASVSDLFYSET
ncbi:beta strand repeat-containing protein [Thalassospira sp.]|uniref:beta strand repeat-containing protein n=1 Tax=Thalassospira sp. TaxID=1912094 RepID=UPI003AA959FD